MAYEDGMRRPPHMKVREMSLKLHADLWARLEAYCLRRATVPPFRNIVPATVAHRGLIKYLEELEAEEALLPHRRARPACAVARGAGGEVWCPEHDVRWIRGTDEDPESCRGSE